jgi:7-carboxy-7-deazaguanine synthase
VTVTGGEPLLQDQTPILIADMLARGYDVSMETNGSLDISVLDPRCTIVMDIKCPSSGMHAYNRLSNLKRLGFKDQVKFVIADRTDFEFACRSTEGLDADFPRGNILFSPAHGQLAAVEVADWMLADGTDARLHIQLHKYLWPDIQRGV